MTKVTVPVDAADVALIGSILGLALTMPEKLNDDIINTLYQVVEKLTFQTLEGHLNVNMDL